MDGVTVEKAFRVVQAVRDLHDDTGKFLDQYGHRPSPNSKAFLELHSFQRPESLITAYSQSGILIDVAADELIAFTKTVTEPAQSIAPWTCVRSIIESSAIACWLLDPALNETMRVQRSLAFRYEGLVQQERFGSAIAKDDYHAEVLSRIEAVEKLALSMGFSKQQNKKGVRTGIAQKMPNITDIVKEMLNEEATYRLLSAVIHGHAWALQQLSFHKIDGQTVKLVEEHQNEERANIFEKHLDPSHVVYLCLKAANTFARPVWYRCQLFGWDTKRFSNILDNSFDALGFRKDSAFWHTA